MKITIDYVFKIGLLILGAVALLLFYFSIEANRYSYHPLEYSDCQIMIFDKNTGTIYLRVKIKDKNAAYWYTTSPFQVKSQDPLGLLREPSTVDETLKKS